MVKVHITGVDKVVRELRELGGNIEEALDEACEEAANHLAESIGEKFGVLQPGWQPLAESTIWSKGNDEPLIETGDMMFSFQVETSNASRKHTATVYSDDPKLKYHVYGTIDTPQRDPVRPTTKEERDECIDIIRRKVEELWHA